MTIRVSGACDRIGCHNQFFRDDAEFDLPDGWLSVREYDGEGEYIESIYCSRDCMRTVENDD